MGRHAATRMGLTMGGFGFAEGTGDTMLGSPNTQGEGGMSVLGDDNATTGGATANNAAEDEAEEARKRRKEEQEKAEAERLKELKKGRGLFPRLFGKKRRRRGGKRLTSEELEAEHLAEEEAARKFEEAARQKEFDENPKVRPLDVASVTLELATRAPPRYRMRANPAHPENMNPLNRALYNRREKQALEKVGIRERTGYGGGAGGVEALRDATKKVWEQQEFEPTRLVFDTSERDAWELAVRNDVRLALDVPIEHVLIDEVSSTVAAHHHHKKHGGAQAAANAAADAVQYSSSSSDEEDDDEEEKDDEDLYDDDEEEEVDDEDDEGEHEEDVAEEDSLARKDHHKLKDMLTKR